MANEAEKGVLIPAKLVSWLRESIDEMHDIYNDKSRDDWFDGDDIAIEIANAVDELLSAADE